MSYQREFPRRIRVGLVGAGSHSYRNVLPTMTFLPVELAAICDLDKRLAAATARQYGAAGVYDSTAAMYAREKLDAAFICVSPQMHPRLVAEALGAGLHVWFEKPPAMRAAEVKDLIGRRGDRVVVCGLKKVFMPATRKVQEILGQSRYQPLRSIVAEHVMSIPENGRQVLDGGQYTNWLGNGCHPLSLMVEVGGRVRAVTVHRGRHGGGACILEYESGAIGTLHLAEGSPRPTERYSFYGNGVEITIDNGWRVTMQRGIPFEYGRTTSYAPEGLEHGAIVWEPQNSLATLENKALFTQGFYDEMRSFCDCVLEGRPAERGGLELALHVMEIYEAALLGTGSPVAVGDPGGSGS